MGKRFRAPLVTAVIALVVVASAGSVAGATPPHQRPEVRQLLVRGGEATSLPTGTRDVTTPTAGTRGFRVLEVPAPLAAITEERLRSRGAQVTRNDLALGAARTPDDPDAASAWGTRVTRTTEVWDDGVRGRRTVIAVLDTGVDRHPDLERALLPGQSVVGADHGAEATDWSPFKHGTDVALTAVARGDNGVGAMGYCWSCSILPVRVLDASGRGRILDVAEGIDWAVANGAHIINLSLAGCLSAAASLLEAAIDDAVAAGVVVFAAAGNGEQTPGCSGTTQPTVPASYPHVIGVAATMETDVLLGSSSRGSWVDVAAPGCHPARTNRRFCGTSAAAPAAAGIAGLLRSLAPRVTADGLRVALSTGAVDIGGVVAEGRIDSLASYERLVRATVRHSDRAPQGIVDRFRG